MNKKIAALAIGAVVLIAGAYAVIGNKNKGATDVSAKTSVTITDARGEVEVPANPKTVVSFDYGVIDALDSMGIEVAGLPKGSLPSSISKYNDDKYAALGGLKEPDFEAVSALNPDLIIISGRQEDMYDKFAEIAPTIFLSVDGSKYIEDLTRNLNVLGTIFNKEDVVEEKLATIQDKIEELSGAIKEKDVDALTMMVSEGELSVYSATSRFGIIYNELGMNITDEKIETSSHGQKVSFEYLVEKNPEYLLVIDKGAAVGKEGTAKSVLDNELVKSTDAYKNGNIIYLTSEAWYTIAGGVNSTLTMLNDLEAILK